MALFKSIMKSSDANVDRIKYYVPSFDRGVAWESVEPLIRSAEMQFIAPAIGDALYNELATAYAGYPLAAMSAPHTNIIRKLQYAVGHFTSYLFVQSMMLHLADMGAVESTGDKMIMPRQWVTRTSLKYHWQQAWIFLDKALVYLEDHADDYPTWKNSDAFGKQVEGFITTSKDLGGYIPTQVNSLVFQQLKPHLAEAQIRYIKPVLGEAFYKELIAAIKTKVATPLTTDQKDAIHQVRWALAKWALHSAIPYLQMEIGADGMVQPSYSDGIDKREKLGTTQLNALWVDTEQAARLFTLDLRNWLQSNADSFPTFKNSDAYAGETPYEGTIDANGYTDPETDDYSANTAFF